mmetsp:Transcript_31806/g.77030  ORF Transcript_31806/g.77030 Transcript_31806/m.77030 type:complete len:444 (+) Transcript_31806:212-1543(+)
MFVLRPPRPVPDVWDYHSFIGAGVVEHNFSPRVTFLASLCIDTGPTKFFGAHVALQIYVAALQTWRTTSSRRIRTTVIHAVGGTFCSHPQGHADVASSDVGVRAGRSCHAASGVCSTVGTRLAAIRLYDGRRSRAHHKPAFYKGGVPPQLFEVGACPAAGISVGAPVVISPLAERKVADVVGIREGEVAGDGIGLEGVGERGGADASPTDVEVGLIDIERGGEGGGGVGEVVNHLRVLNNTIIAVGEFVNINDRAREGRHHVSLLPPACEDAVVYPAVPRQRRGEEGNVRIRSVVLVRPRLVDEIPLALIPIAVLGGIGGPGTVILIVGLLVEAAVHRYGLLDLVDPRRAGISVLLGGHGLAVHIRGEVRVHIAPGPNADCPRLVAAGIYVRHHRLEEALLEGHVVGKPIRPCFGPRPIVADRRRGLGARRLDVAIILFDEVV